MEKLDLHILFPLKAGVKMRKVSTSRLRPGMKLGQAVYSDRGEVLLGQGMTLTGVYINKLVLLGVPFIYIEDTAISGVAVPETVSRETFQAAQRQVKKILLSTRDSGRLVIEPHEIYSTVSQLASQLFDSKPLAFTLSGLRSRDEYTFSHSVNVCVLALMTGMTMGYSGDLLAVLGVGALLHDIGKMKIPDEILNKPGELTGEEYSIMQKHATLGFEVIRSYGKLGDIPAQIAHQHHESYDGSGYPLGISGDDFFEYSQIVSIADKFDALTSDRVYRQGYPPHEAYEMFAAAGNLWFKETVVKAFLHNIAAYPAGAVVELSNGSAGVVLGTPKGCSRFPNVRVLFDKNRKPIKDTYEISLSEKPGIYVVKVLSEDDYYRD